MGLYTNTKRMTSFFAIAIAGVTLILLVLRLTVLRDMASEITPGNAGTSQNAKSSEIIGDGDFPYSLNGKIYFETAKSEGNVCVSNPEGNIYLLSINIMLPDTKDSLFYTGAIEAGTSIDNAKLSLKGQSLEDGEYDCIAEISAVDPDTLKYVQSEDKEVTVYIGVKPS